jgi:hypothetical protein
MEMHRQSSGTSRPTWRSLLLFVLFVALWWFFALAPSCDLGGPKPSELIPAEQRGGEAAGTEAGPDPTEGSPDATR